MRKTIVSLVFAAIVATSAHAQITRNIDKASPASAGFSFHSIVHSLGIDGFIWFIPYTGYSG